MLGKKNAGFSLIMLLFMIILFAITGTALVKILNREYDIMNNHYGLLQARHAAESAVVRYKAQGRSSDVCLQAQAAPLFGFDINLQCLPDRGIEVSANQGKFGEPAFISQHHIIPPDAGSSKRVADKRALPHSRL